jgi:hypothetical protein|tara:strand:- start:2065 stop:2202 length:138 start_codon:yes stop_codon:yes gene_type:complete
MKSVKKKLINIINTGNKISIRELETFVLISLGTFVTGSLLIASSI